jgi:transposase
MIRAGDLMKRFVEGVERGQATLFPDCLEDWATGRPSYHPSVLLKLYIYGYLNRVQSSRRLEREAGRNVEVMWLTGRLVPDHKTIADFRKDSGPAIRRVCAQFVTLCRQLGLLAKGSVAIDGSKFKAVNNRDRNQLHGCQDEAPHGADRGERQPLSASARQRGSSGALACAGYADEAS